MANVYQKDGMVVSAGCVYDLNKDSWLASAEGGIVVEFNPEVYLNQAEKTGFPHL